MLDDWQPLLLTPEGRAWYRPIALLGEDGFAGDQDDVTKTPALRTELAHQIPQAVLNIHAHWLPLRRPVHERQVAKLMRPKVGRDEPCPCGSGKKFKKCCGAAAELH